jgi:hypothetical protein
MRREMCHATRDGTRTLSGTALSPRGPPRLTGMSDTVMKEVSTATALSISPTKDMRDMRDLERDRDHVRDRVRERRGVVPLLSSSSLPRSTRDTLRTRQG